MQLCELAEMVCGRVLGGSGRAAVSGLSIDSRKLRPGEVFVALAAGKADGHAHIQSACAAGAAGAVVSRTPDAPQGFPLILVDDTRDALLRFGRERFRRWGGELAVGVTGSTGKTTTKEFASCLLESRYKVFKTPGNYNNTIGMPLSFWDLEPPADAAVLEMGMSSPGEIRSLCEMAPPHVAVVTNVGSVHLEYFRDKEALAGAKEEIVIGLRRGGSFVYNAEDPFVAAMARRFEGEKISFGTRPGRDVRVAGWRVGGLDSMSVDLEWRGGSHAVPLRFAGAHFAWDLAAAVGVCLAAGLPDERILSQVGRLRPAAMRGVPARLAGGVQMVDDSYNSNPEAMASVVDTLARWDNRPPTLFVAGEMRELGPESTALHRETGRRIASLGGVRLVAVAGHALHMAEEAAKSGCQSAFFESATEAESTVLRQVCPGDLVVVKGSRGVGLDRLAESLRLSLPLLAAGAAVENSPPPHAWQGEGVRRGA